jgi:tetratricopeptide (TPR) repeat protein
MTGQDRFEDAMGYYHQALNIFQEQRAWEWQVLIYRQMAYSRWCTRDLNDAWVYIRTSQDLAIKYQVSRELPAIYYTLGLIIWDDFPDLDRAAAIFKRGLEESRSHHDGQMVIANLVALVEIAYRQDDEAQAERLTSEIRAEIRDGNLNYPLLEGRLERILAETAYDKGNYDRSLEHYLRAIPLIAQHGGYSIYKLSTALLFLSSRMGDLLPLQALHWSHTMKAAWESIKELSDFCDEQIVAAQSRLGQESS